MVSLAESLITALDQPGQERLRDLVRNPLCLTLLCHIWDDSALPDTQAELYGKYLKKHYDWNHNRQHVIDHARSCNTNTTNIRKQLDRQLGELAKEALNTPQEGFRLSQNLVEKYLGEEYDDQSLCCLALRLGLLNRVGKDRGNHVFAFYHATFQEYFGAMTIPDWDYFLPRDHVNFPVAGKEYRIFDPQWKQVILLWLGRGDIAAEEKEDFINKLVTFETGCDGNFYYYRAYFLAAEGINEFKDCSLSIEIVKQVVNWELGCFSSEKQEWQTFLYTVEEDSRNIIPRTITKLVITELISILKHCLDKVVRRIAAYVMGEIAQGNLEAISDLLFILETTEYEDTRSRIVNTLGEIAEGNKEVISTLVYILKTTVNKETLCQAVYSLGAIAEGNKEVITLLIYILETTEDYAIRSAATNSLSEISQKNPDAITALICLLKRTKNIEIRWRTVCILGEISQENPQVIIELIHILETTEDEFTRFHSAYSLGKIDPENPNAITALVRILETTEDVELLSMVVESFGEIAYSNPIVIKRLVHILGIANNENICLAAAESLGKVDPKNLEAIAALVHILEATEDVNICSEDVNIYSEAAYILSDIDPENPNVTAAFLYLLKNTHNKSTYPDTVYMLGKIAYGNQEVIEALLHILKTNESPHAEVGASLANIAHGNQEVIEALLHILKTNKSKNTLIVAAYSLGMINLGNLRAISTLVLALKTSTSEDMYRISYDLKEILTTPEQCKCVITAFKDCFNNEVRQSNFDLYANCYKVLWQCAENLPYPEFYQVWHHPSTTSHP